MKKYCLFALVCVLLCTFSVAHADSYGDWLGGLTSLFSSGEQETEEEFPDLSKPFTGETVSVIIAGKTVKVHKELIEAMEAYEAFFDEYIEAMTGDNLFGYAEMLIKYGAAMEALAEIDEEQWSNGDIAYYLEVMNRINQKLLLTIE